MLTSLVAALLLLTLAATVTMRRIENETRRRYRATPGPLADPLDPAGP